ncbi:hypothetical protein BHM03_00025879 [Ensete ventricosum]|uniref:DUF1279 domain-containing protein n=1 Tax=Ensete ventricosum TaxID=4639 RepID=A0A445MHA5_ENSVE|nr:hypothetical protein BHM03_00025879 [Ensete ventricosum]
MATAALLLSTLPPPQRHGVLRYHHSPRPRCRLLPASPLQGRPRRRLLNPIRALQETEEKAKASSSAEEITEKYGLEFGLWKIFSSKEGGDGAEGEGKEKSKADQAKELLAKYGGAYLATSITLSLISFSLCYLLVSAGIDVQALLNKVRHENLSKQKLRVANRRVERKDPSLEDWKKDQNHEVDEDDEPVIRKQHAHTTGECCREPYERDLQ